ncbi:MAG: ATP-binding protein, partial [Myxococcales bacterium]|nr:ATP-binding protein [Myxococcales bacterium]
SEVFGFTRGGSREGELAIRWAEAFMDGDLDALPAQLRDKHALDAELRRVLAASDPFWVRWFVQNQDVGT